MIVAALCCLSITPGRGTTSKCRPRRPLFCDYAKFVYGDLRNKSPEAQQLSHTERPPFQLLCVFVCFLGHKCRLQNSANTYPASLESPRRFRSFVVRSMWCKFKQSPCKNKRQILSPGGIGRLCTTKCRNGEKFVGQPGIIVFNYVR